MTCVPGRPPRIGPADETPLAVALDVRGLEDAAFIGGYRDSARPRPASTPATRPWWRSLAEAWGVWLADW